MHEAEGANEAGGSNVGRLDVGLDPVQPHALGFVGEDEVENELEPLGEEALADVGVIGVVTDARAVEGPPDDVADVGAAHEVVVALRLQGMNHEGPIGRGLVGDDGRQVVRVGHGVLRQASRRPRDCRCIGRLVRCGRRADLDLVAADGGGDA